MVKPAVSKGQCVFGVLFQLLVPFAEDCAVGFPDVIGLIVGGSIVVEGAVEVPDRARTNFSIAVFVRVITAPEGIRIGTDLFDESAIDPGYYVNLVGVFRFRTWIISAG